jgi:hypothetical protein
MVVFRKYACVRPREMVDCGPAALATIALHYRRPIGIEQMRDLTGTDRIGSNLLGLLKAYDYQRYGTVKGTVCFISPDSGVSESQPKASYLVRITSEGDDIGRGEFHGKVKLGMAGQADVVTDRECLLKVFAKKIRRTISLG